MNDGGPASIIRVPAGPTLEAVITLEGEAVAAVERWQGRRGDILTVVDAQQICYRARIEQLTSSRVELVPFERLEHAVEPRLPVTLYQALPDKERFELILQKATELGVSRIVPMQTVRSATVEQRDAGQKKSHRWPDVLLRAARQCRRAQIPELAPVMGWTEVLDELAGCDCKLLLYEQQTGWSLGEVMRTANPSSVALLVGPEGGFTGEEVTAARDRGCLPVGLGPRILRTETAAIAAAAIIQFAIGDMG